MKRGYVDTPEGQIHYRTMGNGEVLLMLHQTPTSSDEYSDSIRILAERFRVVAMDSLGYGNSDALDHQPSIEEYAQNTLHFMDAMGIPKAHLLGHHTGAVVAVEISATRPERVGKLVLSSLSGRADRPGVPSEHAVKPKMDYEHPEPDGEFLVKKWNMYRSFCLPGAAPEVWYPIFLAALACEERIHDGHLASYDYNISERLPKIKSPTLALLGLNDPYVIDIDFVVSLLHDCQVTKIEGGGIFMPREKYKEFAEAILRFL